MPLRTVTHGGEGPCFEETQNPTCPLCAQGILRSCIAASGGLWSYTHLVASSRPKTAKTGFKGKKKAKRSAAKAQTR